jgi:hypothetical protein
VYPEKSNKPAYGQLYIIDSAEATPKRLKTNQIKGVYPK